MNQSSPSEVVSTSVQLALSPFEVMSVLAHNAGQKSWHSYAVGGLVVANPVEFLLILSAFDHASPRFRVKDLIWWTGLGSALSTHNFLGNGKTSIADSIGIDPWTSIGNAYISFGIGSGFASDDGPGASPTDSIFSFNTSVFASIAEAWKSIEGVASRVGIVTSFVEVVLGWTALMRLNGIGRVLISKSMDAALEDLVDVVVGGRVGALVGVGLEGSRVGS